MIISVFNDLNYQRVTRFSCLFYEDNLSQRQKTSKKALIKDSHRVSSPSLVSLEIHLPQASLNQLYKYTAKTLYNTTLIM